MNPLMYGAIIKYVITLAVIIILCGLVIALVHDTLVAQELREQKDIDWFSSSTCESLQEEIDEHEPYWLSSPRKGVIVNYQERCQ